MEAMQRMKNRNSTYQNYYTIWKLFNSFLVRLDYLPRSWEERTALFCIHLTQKGKKINNGQELCIRNKIHADR